MVMSAACSSAARFATENKERTYAISVKVMTTTVVGNQSNISQNSTASLLVIIHTAGVQLVAVRLSP
jgi:hypothetical protein